MIEMGAVSLKFEKHGGYAMVVFGCGQSYIGPYDEVEPAVERHRLSGCKKCHRYQRRMERLQPPPEASA